MNTCLPAGRIRGPTTTPQKESKMTVRKGSRGRKHQRETIGYSYNKFNTLVVLRQLFLIYIVRFRFGLRFIFNIRVSFGGENLAPSPYPRVIIFAASTKEQNEPRRDNTPPTPHLKLHLSLLHSLQSFKK